MKFIFLLSAADTLLNPPLYQHFEHTINLVFASSFSPYLYFLSSLNKISKPVNPLSSIYKTAPQICTQKIQQWWTSSKQQGKTFDLLLHTPSCELALLKHLIQQPRVPLLSVHNLIHHSKHQGRWLTPLLWTLNYMLPLHEGSSQ